MKFDEIKTDLVPSIIAGIINAIICIVSAMALAALIFTGPLAGFLPQGIGILLMGTVIFAVLSAITATYPLIFSAPQDIPIAILALMAATVAASVNGEMTAVELFQFIFVAIGLTSILVGVFFFILGRFKLGKIVRFIPFPVIGGFLAGTGWLIVKFSFAMMTNLELNPANLLALFQENVFYHWFPGLLFAIVLLLVTRKSNHYLVKPGILFGSIILFYIFMFTQGYTYSEIENNGYLLGPFPTGGLFPGLPFAYVPQFRWDLFIVHLPAIATMMILNAIALLFNYSGLEIIVKEDFDFDKELRITGFNNILAGLAGTSAGYMTLSETSMSYNLGSRSRIPSIVVALICILTLVFGAGVLSIFPKVILGGLLLNLGLEFLEEWLISTWKKLHVSDYMVIVVILIVIASMGFLEGIVVGLLVSIIVFVINYSKVEVVKYELTGKTFKSNVERSENLKQVIEQCGDQIFILSLQGFIFFGTAHHLLQRVVTRSENTEDIPLRYLLFDFRQVSGIDSSVLNSFNKLQVIAKKNNFYVLLCGLNEDMRSQLSGEGLVSNDSGLINSFVDLDHGLEWCEEKIILSVQQDADAAIKINDNSVLLTIFNQISEYLEDRKVPANTVIVEQGKDPGGIFFLESGQITVRLNSGTEKQMRLKTMGPGTIVGEVSLYLDSKATASVVTDVDCEIKFLSKENFKKINMEAPEKASGLHIFVVKLLSDRLAESNATIQALIR
jgi:SulP family sulfate permease